VVGRDSALLNWVTLKRRVAIAVGVGTLVGGMAVGSFGPLVRSQIQDRAAPYGARVDVEHVVPSLDGVELRGVEVRLEDVPGVTVWFARVDVGWDKRPNALEGGMIKAVGPLDELVGQAKAWREAHRPARGGSTASTGRALELDGLEVHWQERAGDVSRGMDAKDVALRKEGTLWAVRAGEVQAQWSPWALTGRGLAVAVRRADTGETTLAQLESEALELHMAGAETAPALPPTDGAGEAGPAPTASAGASEPESKAPEEAAPSAVSSRERSLRLRVLRKKVDAIAEELDRLVEADAKIDVGGASADLRMGSERLRLGPGHFSLERDDGDLVIALSPEGSSNEPAKLTFEVLVPRVDRDQPASERPLRAQLRGGPVGLSLLGVQGGDLGLTDVEQASLEAHVGVSLAADGKVVSIDGRGKVHDLALESKKFAADPIEGIELAWRGKLNVHVDEERLVFPEMEVDLGDLRFITKGELDRNGRDLVSDIDFEIPLMTCQSAFDSIPKAMVPLLEGSTFAGSLSAVGHAKFDTAAIEKTFDVDWDGTLGCRVASVPPRIDVSNFKKSFQKVVYTPEGEEQSMTFGPDDPKWVPIGSVSRFMEAAVLTTEDGGFFRHRGFSQGAIINSMKDNLIARRFRRGASTISMQVAKNLYLPRTKHLSRKLQEAILTMYLEQALTKREILELYFNIIEYGPMIYGLEPAAKHYFNAHPGRLSLSQSLYLASILPSPNKHFFGAGGAVTGGRMSYLRTLMKIMEKLGRISEDELELGLRETVVFGSPSPHVAPPENEDIYDIEESDGAEGTDT